MLTELGFLSPVGWEDEDLLDDENEVGPVAAKVDVRVESSDPDESNSKVADLEISEGHVTSGNLDSYRLYRVRTKWVTEHLKGSLEGTLDAPAIEEINKYLFYLGTLVVDGRDVPVYLVRCIDNEKVRSSVDTEVRARHHLGIGLVLQAGNAGGPCLAANVMTPLADQIEGDQPEIALVADKLRSVFRRQRGLARGGLTVDFTRVGDNMAMLSVPGAGTIDIKGENRIAVIQRLVDAHNSGPMPMATADLIKGIAEDPDILCAELSARMAEAIVGWRTYQVVSPLFA